MDYESLPHFCRKEGSGSSKHQVAGDTENCFSFDSSFHQQLYNFIKQQANVMQSRSPIRQGSFYADLPEPDPDDAKIAKTIESEFHKLEIQNGSMNGLKVNMNSLKVKMLRAYTNTQNKEQRHKKESIIGHIIKKIVESSLK
ncbi:hypothetical protein PIB30_080259 [Stylosanthes scabra]|uniref:Uncharacterized protein n=1 Tax=Stylosanthes scabra TaxID=79078 RepID=A0ABU6WPN3_9FABA|nr:hypothetical protein [Stylosanthes scabra]